MTLDQCWSLEASVHLKQHLVDMILQARKMNVLASLLGATGQCVLEVRPCADKQFIVSEVSKTVSAIRSRAGEKEKARCYTA